MALATRCPYCRTTFRVANDQLKLRAGLVRCGACKQVFNGVEHLLPSEAAAASSVPPSSLAAPAAAPSAASSGELGSPAAANAQFAPSASPSLNDFLQDGEAEHSERPKQTEAYGPQVSEDETQHRPNSEQPASDEERPDPLQRMTLMDFTAFEEDGHAQAADAVPDKESLFQADEETRSFAQDMADTPDDLDKTIAELQSKPWRKSKRRRLFAKQIHHDDDDALEPAFVSQANRRQRIGRVARIAMGAGSAVLMLTLLGQTAYAFRDQTAARWPETKPILAQFCGILGCRIDLPSQIDMLSIESSELQASASDQAAFTLGVLLRNRSAIAQSWPKLELSLNDANEKPLVRRIFDPREYLPPAQDAAKGFAANSEQTVKLHFALSQLKASGYRVYLFYP